MSLWFHGWFVLAGIVGIVWIIRFANTGRILRKRQILSSTSYDHPPDPAPKVSVVVAAKDEEANIKACVTSLLNQDYPNFELIVVDDRSCDRTPEILAKIQRTSGGRMQVVRVGAVRDGWFGKNNAMREGVSASTGDWLLFTDADCTQTSRKTLSVAMREALGREVDFLSITPVLETHAVWERMIQPVCTLVLMTWFLPHRVNRPHRKTAYANGAFMLMRRSCYDAIGGHERVRTEVNEDIQMARLTKQLGLRLRVVENDDLYRTRMYDSLLGAWRGWSRIYYGSFASWRNLVLAASFVILASLVPWVSLLTALTGLAVAHESPATPWVIAGSVWLVIVALEQTMAWRLYKTLRAPPVWSLAYFLGAAVALGMLTSAMLKKAGVTRTTWRGTTYRGSRLEGPSAVDGGHPVFGEEQAKRPATH